VKETTVDQGEQITGTRDEHYNLVSVLYHALNAADTCDRYALEAKQHLGIHEPPQEFGGGSAAGG
jgi:hypothetical protein